MKKFGYVYLTTNLVNNKKYIGVKQSDKYETWYLGSGTVIKKAIIKYGKENFSNRVLQWCYSEQELSKSEISWINKNNAVNNLMYYNLQSGGYSGKHSDETKAYLSKIRKGKKHSEETKLKMKNVYKNKSQEEKDLILTKLHRPIVGEKRSQEIRDKISKGRKGIIFTKVHCKNIAKSRIGKHHTQESKNKISKKLKGRKLSKKICEKYSKAQLGYKQRRVICPHCKKEGGVNNMVKYHFNNCKNLI